MGGCTGPEFQYVVVRLGVVGASFVLGPPFAVITAPTICATEAKVRQVAEPWRPYRSLGANLLFSASSSRRAAHAGESGEIDVAAPRPAATRDP